MEVGPGPEVYELDVVAGGVDDDVLVLNVAMDDVGAKEPLADFDYL